MKKIIKYLTKIFIWINSLSVCLLLSFVSKEDSIIISIILILIMLIPIVLKTIYYLKKSKQDKKQHIIDIIFLLTFIIFLLLTNHIDFGYGNTYRLLGYDTPIGIFSVINVSRTTAFILLCISYIIINILFMYRYSFVLEEICLNANIPKKVFINIVLIICVIVEYYEFISYFNQNKLNGMFIYSIVFYDIIYFLINTMLKIETSNLQ